jgi:hypothetical protein
MQPFVSLKLDCVTVAECHGGAWIEEGSLSCIGFKGHAGTWFVQGTLFLPLPPEA